MIGSRRYVSRYPATSPLHQWAQFAVDLPISRCLMTEATRAMIGDSAELDDAGGRQLKMLLTLLRNAVRKHRQLHLARILNWEDQITENKKVLELYDNFRYLQALDDTAFLTTLKNLQEKNALTVDAQTNTTAVGQNY